MRVCNRCNQFEATGHCKIMINGEYIALVLCDSCFKAIVKEQNLFMPDFLPFVNQSYKQIKNEPKCSYCKTTLSQFNETFYLGCPHCYTQLYEYILPAIIKVQGTAKHNGYAPVGHSMTRELCDDSSLLRLRKALSEAVQNENYADATQIQAEIEEIKHRRNVNG